jgi:hypothetical protein
MSKEYNMDDFDKIEKLRQRANVSFSEAGEALRACDGDLLDAMVYLERQGKVAGPEQSSFSTDSAAEKPSYENVPEVVTRSRSEDPDPSFGSQLGHLIKTAFKKSTENFVVISHKGEEKARLPIIVLILALCFFNIAALIAIVVSLFLDVRYRFEGKDDLSSVNKVMDQAETKATEWMNDSYAKKQAAKAKEDAQKKADDARQKAYESSEKAKENARIKAEYAKLKAEEARRKAARENQESNGEPLKTFSEKEVEELAEKYDREVKNNETNDNNDNK